MEKLVYTKHTWMLPFGSQSCDKGSGHRLHPVLVILLYILKSEQYKRQLNNNFSSFSILWNMSLTFKNNYTRKEVGFATTSMCSYMQIIQIHNAVSHLRANG